MGIFTFDAMKSFGTIQSVDTAIIVVRITDNDQLSRLQVNHIIAIRASKAGQTLIGMVSKIMRKYGDETDLAEGEDISSSDIVKATLIGTLLDKMGKSQCI